MSALTARVGEGGTEPSFLPTHLLDRCAYNHKVMLLETVHTKTHAAYGTSKHGTTNSSYSNYLYSRLDHVLVDTILTIILPLLLISLLQ